MTIDSPFEFHQAVKNYVAAITCVYVSNEDVFKELENIEPESIPIRETERSEMKRIYGLKFSYLAQDEKPFFTQRFAMEKMFWYAVMMMEKSIPTFDKAEEWI